MNLELLTIGNELLLGHTVDTNATELAGHLSAEGVRVVRQVTVGDDAAAIGGAVEQALDRTGAVLTTGGLGPTKDDLTKAAVAGVLGRELVLDEVVLAQVEDRFRRIGRWPMPEINRTQAEVPVGSVPLENKWGTAPGLWIEDGERLVIMLPGVPKERRGLLHAAVIPLLRRRAAAEGSTGVIRSLVVRTTGIAEAALAERLAHLEDEVPPATLAFLPSILGVDLRLTVWDEPTEVAESLLAEKAALLEEAAGPHAYGREDADVAEVVLGRLRASGRMLSVGESCTGGLVGARLTAIPGSSDVFVGGIIAYDNDVKLGKLGVPTEVLESHGAVSEEAVRAMAIGAHQTFDTWASIAVTGIAGPGGGTPEKPVGTVWLAAAMGDEVFTKRVIFPGSRQDIRERSAQAAIDLLRRRL